MRSSRARWNITRNWEPLHNILASDPDTEKTLNDTYFSAWNTIPPHEPRTYLFPYLARITRCLSIDLSKKGWRSHQCRRVPVYRYDQDLLRNHKLTKLDKLQKSRLLRQWEHFALCNRTRNNRIAWAKRGGKLGEHSTGKFGIPDNGPIRLWTQSLPVRANQMLLPAVFWSRRTFCVSLSCRSRQIYYMDLHARRNLWAWRKEIFARIPWWS